MSKINENATLLNASAMNCCPRCKLIMNSFP